MYVYLPLSTCTSVHVHVSSSTCTCVLYTCMYVHVYSFTYTYMYLYVHVCVSSSIHIRIIHTHSTCKCMFIHLCSILTSKLHVSSSIYTCLYSHYIMYLHLHVFMLASLEFWISHFFVHNHSFKHGSFSNYEFNHSMNQFENLFIRWDDYFNY